MRLESAVLNTFDLEMCFAPQWRALFRHLDDIWRSKSGRSMWCFVHFHFHTCFAPQWRALFRHLNFQKCSDSAWCVLCSLTSTCASRHNGVPFFNIATSKSRPNVTVSNTVHVEMCFAPQRRALFQHLNFQLVSAPDGF